MWVSLFGPQNTQFFVDGIRPFNIKEEPPMLDVEAEVIRIQEEVAKAALIETNPEQEDSEDGC